MVKTSLGQVSNSSSNTFTNALGIISLINYGRVVGSNNYYETTHHDYNHDHDHSSSNSNHQNTQNFQILQNKSYKQKNYWQYYLQ